MALYMQQSSRYWWVSIYIPGSATGGNARRYLRTSTGTADKIKAQAIEQALKLGLHRSVPGEHLHKLLDALLGVESKAGIPIDAIWTEYQRIWGVGGKHIAERTQRDRERFVTRLIGWIKKNRPTTSTIGDVDKLAASAYAEALKREGMKSKTRKNIIGELSAVWQVVASVHDVQNPWPGVAPQVDDAERGRAFTRKQEASLLAAADAAGHGWGTMCRIARHTGLRYGDIAGLTHADVDQDGKALVLRPSKTSRWNIAVLLPLPDAVFSGLPASKILFPEAKECLPRQMWRLPFSAVLEAAGLAGKGFTFHSWRHTFRTRLSEAGVKDDIAKRLGGWTQDKTAAHYDHSERLAELRAAVESAMS